MEVSDRGVGIPASHHDKVFTQFHRAHSGSDHRGTGLGLAICQRIVERHGGTISVTDNPRGGSRFHFTLPGGTHAPPEAVGRDRPVVLVEQPAGATTTRR